VATVICPDEALADLERIWKRIHASAGASTHTAVNW
jgi:hypothetical protein